jgi:pimeloyl-ACP methyl ester carboxylesterase
MSSRSTIAALALGLLCLCAAAAFAQAPERVPHINDEGQRAYRTYLNQGFRRAFVISENGAYGSAWGNSDIEVSLKNATESCQRRDPKGPCKPYSVDGYVVWGKDYKDLLRYVDAPKYGRFIPSDYTQVRGPEAAPGLVVWSHGYFRGVDATQGQPHGYVSRFLASGWDVYRYNRQWVDQLSLDIQGLIEGVAAAKAAGYKKVILVGQSQGAWISMEALAKGVQADGVISTAMARHGEPPSREARQDFRQLIRNIKSSNTNIPVVLTLFAGDGYDPGGRNIDVKDTFSGAPMPLYFIEHPAEFSGHGSGSNSKFNERFGACIFRFVTTSPPAPGECK